MMASLLDPVITATVVLLMTLAGTGITVAELGAAVRRPWLLAAATLGQVLLLPGVALLTARLVGADATMTLALLLIGTAPGGALSNVYAYVLAADVALSVTLTAASTVLAVVTMPLMLGAAMQLGLGSATTIALPTGRIAFELFTTLAIPVVAGMLLRAFRNEFFTAHRRTLRSIGLVVVAVVVLLVLAVNVEALADRWFELLLASAVYTLLAALLGIAFAVLATSQRAERVAVALEFTCRNTPAALLVASVALGRDDLAVFAAVLLIVQTPLLLGLARGLAPLSAQRAGR